MEYWKNLDLQNIVYFDIEIKKNLIEVWLDVIGYEGRYEVSNLGRIKSLLKYGNNTRILKQRIVKKGYLNIRLTDKKTYTHKVHRLVAEAFIPNTENKPQVNHKNGIKINNRKDNLEWSTNKENALHAWNNGLAKAKKGSENGKATLTEKQVLEIRRIGKSKTLLEISKIYNVKLACIHKILQRKTWKHI